MSGREELNVMGLLSKKKTSDTSQTSENIAEIEITKIEPPLWQPRKKFEEQKLKELASSIKEHGLLQPLVVEKAGTRFRLVSGERRYRALQTLNITKVPVRILENLTQEERIQIQIAENLQREDITPMERSRAIYKLFQEQVHPVLDNCINTLTLFRRSKDRLDPETVDTVSTLLKRLGKSPKTVERWLSLLKLPAELQDKLDDPNGVFTPKHAGEILKLKDIQSQLEVAALIEGGNLSAEETKEVVKSKKEDTKKIETTSPTLFAKTTTKWITQVKSLNFEKVKADSKNKLLKEIEIMEKQIEDLKKRLTT